MNLYDLWLIAWNPLKKKRHTYTVEFKKQSILQKVKPPTAVFKDTILYWVNQAENWAQELIVMLLGSRRP
jgi:hypothetical protein